LISAVAFIVVVLILVVMMMFSGFLIDLSSVVQWLSWIQWISAFRFASNALIINEFRGLVFCMPNMTDVCPLTGEQVIQSQGLTYATNWDLWKYLFALIVMAITFFIFSYIQLVRIKKTR
jgi:ATP-binding cassette, subfamily G (WHITE), member 2